MSKTLDWPTYRHDNRRSGCTLAAVDPARLAGKWTWRSGHPPVPAWSGPAKYDAFSRCNPLRSMRNYDPAFHVTSAGGSVFFGSSVDDSVRCLDLESGEERWRSKSFGKYWSMVWQNDKILALDESGELLLLRANAQSFELLDRKEVSKGEAWGYLAVHGDRVFVRDLESVRAFHWPARTTP